MEYPEYATSANLDGLTDLLQKEDDAAASQQACLGILKNLKKT